MLDLLAQTTQHAVPVVPVDTAWTPTAVITVVTVVVGLLAGTLIPAIIALIKATKAEVRADAAEKRADSAEKRTDVNSAAIAVHRDKINEVAEKNPADVSLIPKTPDA
jgi:hypothetical protein